MTENKQIKKQNILKEPNVFNIKQFQNTQVGISHYEQLKEKPVLFVENLYKKYPRKKSPAINNISFNVYPGQFHAFIGANGAGKTTSIKSIIGAYAIWTGTVLINGKKNTSVEAKKQLGYIPENARFPANMTCYSYLTWMARLSGLTKASAKKFALDKIKDLNLLNLKNKSPNSFSSGQKKKVLLAQALINDPTVLIMDEPAANLDPKARIELFETLLKLQKQGKAILISSHILAEIDKYANAATILDGGKIIYSGSTKQLYSKHAEKKYLVRVKDDSDLTKYLKAHKISYTQDNENYYLRFDNKAQESAFLSAASSKKFELTNYQEVGTNLDDIYKKLIKFGSVDTMEGSNDKQ